MHCSSSMTLISTSSHSFKLFHPFKVSPPHFCLRISYQAQKPILLCTFSWSHQINNQVNVSAPLCTQPQTHIYLILTKIVFVFSFLPFLFWYLSPGCALLFSISSFTLAPMLILPPNCPVQPHINSEQESWDLDFKFSCKALAAGLGPLTISFCNADLALPAFEGCSGN